MGAQELEVLVHLNIQPDEQALQHIEDILSDNVFPELIASLVTGSCHLHHVDMAAAVAHLDQLP